MTNDSAKRDADLSTLTGGSENEASSIRVRRVSDSERGIEIGRPVSGAARTVVRPTRRMKTSSMIATGVVIGLGVAFAGVTMNRSPVLVLERFPPAPRLITQAAAERVAIESRVPRAASSDSLQANSSAFVPAVSDKKPFLRSPGEPGIPVFAARSLSAVPAPRAERAVAASVVEPEEPASVRHIISAEPQIDTTGFDKRGASLALADAGLRASVCKASDDLRSSLRVTVTFAGSGRVTAAAVNGGPFAGTEIGSCIARSLRSAQIAPFEGAPVTVSSTIQLR